MGWPVMMPSFGVLLAAVAGADLVGIFEWRGLAAVGILPFFFCVLFILAVPESPRWLIAQGRKEKARKSIAILSRCSLSEVPAHADPVARLPSSSLMELYSQPGRLWLTVLSRS